MSQIRWDDRYLIGIKQFDDEHKELVALLGEVYRQFLSNKAAERKPQEILDALTAYTVVHFAHEEAWMRERNYPRLGKHLLEHREFVDRVSEFQRNFKSGAGHLTLDIISYLRVWLLTHISITDFDLGEFQRAGDSQGAPSAGGLSGVARRAK
jgi:hemerythrin